MSEEIKCCEKCNKEKDTDCFNDYRYSVDGKYPVCKECLEQEIGKYRKTVNMNILQTHYKDYFHKEYL